jgi:hypothetical protein
MSIIEEFRKLDRGHIVFVVGGFISVVAPGFLTIYLFKPDLVGSLDTFKLLVFSAALTLPVVILNHFAAVQLPPSKRLDHQVSSLILAMAMTCAVFYLALVISYFALLTFKLFVATVVVLQVLLFLSMILDQRYSKKP